MPCVSNANANANAGALKRTLYAALTFPSVEVDPELDWKSSKGWRLFDVWRSECAQSSISVFISLSFTGRNVCVTDDLSFILLVCVQKTENYRASDHTDGGNEGLLSVIILNHFSRGKPIKCKSSPIKTAFRAFPPRGAAGCWTTIKVYKTHINNNDI